MCIQGYTSFSRGTHSSWPPWGSFLPLLSRLSCGESFMEVENIQTSSMPLEKAHQLSPWKSGWSTLFPPQATFQINWQDFPPADSKAICIDYAPFSPGTRIWTEHDSSDICWPRAEVTSVSPRMATNIHDESMSLCILSLPICKQHHWWMTYTRSRIISPSDHTSEKLKLHMYCIKDKFEQFQQIAN